MSSSIRRSAFAIFLNVGTQETPDYARIGDGVTTSEISYNPQTREETYIHQDSGVTEIESYRPTMPIEAVAKAGDDVFDYIDGLRKTRAVLDDALTDAVLVYLYESPVEGEYPAEQQPVSVQIESFGGDGGSTVRINYTLNFVGDPVIGTFDPTDADFTPAA
jgi:hypothetical protein